MSIDKDSSNQQWKHCNSRTCSNHGLRHLHNNNNNNNVIIILCWAWCLIAMNQYNNNVLLTLAFSTNRVQTKRSSNKDSRQGKRGSLWIQNNNVRPIISDIGEEEEEIKVSFDDDVSTTHRIESCYDTNDMDSTVGLYIHIPFCRRRCRYCDFAIVPIGDDAGTITDDDDSNMSRQREGFLKMETSYKDAILQEIDILRQSNQQKQQQIPLRSIYFGGGTPSLASIETLKEILDSILLDPQSPFVNPFINNDDDSNEQNQSSLEVTIEIDPGTFSLSKLRSLKGLGFNRLSLGVQSFDDTILEQIGRFHRFDDIERSIDMIKEVYGEDDANYSIDLISGLPGLSLAKWAETLETAVSLSPQPSHLSLYDLQIESGTVFGKWYKHHLIDDGDDDEEEENKEMNGSSRISPAKEPDAIITDHNDLPSATDCAFMYKYASGYLKSKKYEHYEISSYALHSSKSPQTQKNLDRSEKRSRHNQIYWEIDSNWYGK